jgi:hypothetical protein
MRALGLPRDAIWQPIHARVMSAPVFALNRYHSTGRMGGSRLAISEQSDGIQRQVSPGHLACGLRDMGIDEGMPVILDLVGQIRGLRRILWTSDDDQDCAAGEGAHDPVEGCQLLGSFHVRPRGGQSVIQCNECM